MKMNINKPIPEELERGFSECDCGEAIHLHQSGFEIDLHCCSLCKQWVADKEQFMNVPAELMSK